MAKSAPAVSVKTSATLDVKLQPRVRAQLRTQCSEYVDLARQIDALKARQDAIKEFVETSLVKAGETDALMDGLDIDGFKVKMVCGVSKKLDEVALMKAHGLSRADLDAHVVEKDNKPYIRISSPKEKE